MKQYSYLTLFGSFLIIMLIFPKETFAGASSGLLLWFQIILPTLLPFVIISNLLIHTNSVYYLSKLLGPVLKRFFQVSDYGCYAILAGFLCGYPMGAKVIADLMRTNRINRTEGAYLLSFCNNTSPIFLISFVITQNLKAPELLLPCLLIVFSSPILCSFFFRKYYFRSKETCASPSIEGTQICFHFQIIDDAIMNGFETLTRVGGYIILFSVLFSLGQKLPASWILSFLEISNGIPYLLRCGLPFTVSFIAILALVSFGGLCAVAQTYSMIQEVKLPILPYIIQKLITATVTSLFAFLYILFILHQ